MALTDYKQLNSSDLTDRHTSVLPDLIQRLCPDILAEIFIFCLHDIPKKLWRLERISTRKAPLLLCYVCSSWRSLAISTPRLWQILHLYHSSCRMCLTDTGESITNGIRTWLDRSKSLPLSIRGFFCAEDPKSDKAAKCRLILEILSQEISRWESFEICVRRIWDNPPHYGVLPMLHTFRILGSSFETVPFTAAPRLKRLVLHSPFLHPISVSAIPLDQLVELTIGNTQTISIAIEVLQRCPRLESLSLRVEKGNDDSDEDGSVTFRSITQHDTLRRLHLDMLPYVCAVTDCLTLPALKDLSLQTYSYYSPPEVEIKFRCSQLVAFFTRSNCGLQELALHHLKFGPAELLECLSHLSCQTLTRLLIQDDDSSPEMLDRELLIRLTYSDVDDDVPLCPKLAHLELENCYCSDRSFPDLLGRMIQSRCFGRAQDARLRLLRLRNTNSISREDYELLKVAQSNGGLELEYFYREANNSNVIPGGDTGDDVDEADSSNVGD